MRIRLPRPRILVPSVAVVVLAGVGVTALLADEVEDTSAAATTTTQLVEVTTGSVSETVAATGTVAPAESEDLSFGAAGTIETVEVAEGDEVEAGDVLATLGSAELQSAVAEAEAALASAEATLADQEATGASETQIEASETAVAVAEDQLEVAREDLALAALRRRLLLFGLPGVGLAAVLGTVVARGAVRPVERLTGLAEEVATTQDLSRRIDVEGQDEVARLAATFNGMLAAIEQARTAQEQLVADASHELRTPLTSLRTNIEVLARADRLDPAARQALIDDVMLQPDEFDRLVTGLVELARGDRPARRAHSVRMDELVERVVARARTHGEHGVTIRLDARPTTVLAEEDRIERAVSNLIDNAVTYGGAQAPST